MEETRWLYYSNMTLIQHPPLRGAELEGQLIAAVPEGFSVNMATSVWAELSAQACPLLIPAHLCCPRRVCLGVLVVISEGKPTSHLLKNPQKPTTNTLC